MNDIVETLQGMLADCRAIHCDKDSSVARLASRHDKFRALFRDVESPTIAQYEAMQEVIEHCNEFLLETGRLDDDFLFSIFFRGEHFDAREGTIERDDPRLPAGILAGKIINAIEAFSDPVVVPAIVPATPAIEPATPAPVASVPWFAGAKPLEQEILSTVDEKLAGTIWPCDFTKWIIDDKGNMFDARKVQRLVTSLNRILERAGKPCKFKAPNTSENLILVCTTRKKRRKTK